MEKQMKKILDEGDITGKQYSIFFDACLNLHKNAILYGVKSFSLHNDSFKHERVHN